MNCEVEMMTIRKRLLFSNILMICIPAVLAMVFGAIAFKTYGNLYWESMEEMYDDKSGIYSAQSMLYAYKEEMEESDWSIHETEENGRPNLTMGKTRSMEELEEDLARMGYHLRIRMDGENLSGSLTEAGEEKIEDYFEDSYEEIGSLILNADDCAIVKTTFSFGGRTYELSAVRMGGKNSGTYVSYFRRYIVSFVAVFLLFTTAVVLLTNGVLSGRIVRMILKPLNILKEGTREIADGNLDWELSYQRADEFGEVCGEFDRMRSQLKASVEERLRYEQYRKELIAGISHDLRTPLTSIKGYVEGLKDGIANTEEKRERYYDAIHIRALDMERLVDSLSVFSRLENRHYRYRLERVDMKEYVEQVIREYEEEARQKKVLLLLDCRAGDREVLLDVQEMHRVFINLFENSVKYRIREQSVIHIDLEDREQMLLIRVRDDGPGVPEKELPHIFTSFYRGDESRTMPGMGSGLGLAIVKQIIEGHQGSIRAYNEKGLVMVITLPLAEKRNEEEQP